MANGFSGIVLAKENMDELSVLRELTLGDKAKDSFQVLAMEHLHEVLAWLENPNFLCQHFPAKYFSKNKLRNKSHSDLLAPNFDDMVLSSELKKAAMVCALGQHSLLLSGTPGSGKSMFSARLTSVMRKMSASEQIETLKIHSSYLSRLSQDLLSGRPPFRAPHHQASSAAIIGVPDCPGEMSLAHGGVLFLDEFPEFRRDIIESLREPLETGHIRVSRARRKVIWSSKVVLVAACNNCPCGWFGSQVKKCNCPSSRVLAYRRKLSGPILDRIDIHMHLDEKMVNSADFLVQEQKGGLRQGQTQEMCQSVLESFEFARKRNQELAILSNSQLKGEHLFQASALAKKDFQLILQGLSSKLSSKRSIVRCLRVARTLADLALSDSVRTQDIEQALAWSSESCAKKRGDYALGLI